MLESSQWNIGINSTLYLAPYLIGCFGNVCWCSKKAKMIEDNTDYDSRSSCAYKYAHFAIKVKANNAVFASNRPIRIIPNTNSRAVHILFYFSTHKCYWFIILSCNTIVL